MCQRNSNGPFVLGDKVSIADLGVFVMGAIVEKIQMFKFVPPDTLKGYEKLDAIQQAVAKIPEVVAWYDKHPLTKM